MGDTAEMTLPIPEGDGDPNFGHPEPVPTESVEDIVAGVEAPQAVIPFPGEYQGEPSDGAPPEVEESQPGAPTLDALIGERPPDIFSLIGTDEETAREIFASRGFDPDEHLGNPEFAKAMQDYGYAGGGPAGLRMFADELVKVENARAQREADDQRIALLEDAAARFGTVAEDPITVVAQRSERVEQAVAMLVQSQLQAQAERAEEQEFHSAVGAFVSGFTIKGAQPPPQEKMEAALHQSGMLQAEGLTWAQRLTNAHAYLVAHDPTYRESSRPDPYAERIVGRGPRAVRVIPQIPTAGAGVDQRSALDQLIEE